MVIKLLLTISIVCSGFLHCRSQVLIPEKNDSLRQQVWISMGLEPEWVTTIGFSHLMDKQENSTNLYLGGSLKFAPLIVNKGAWRINFNQSVDRQLSQKWKGIITNDIYLAHNRNRAATMNGVGFDFRAAMLSYDKKWIKGFEVGWQYTALTHIRHSNETKNTFNDRYPSRTGEDEPVDGWYGATASRIRLGFLARRGLSKHLALQLGMGSMLSIQKQGILFSFAYAQMPLYFNTMLIYGW